MWCSELVPHKGTKEKLNIVVKTEEPKKKTQKKQRKKEVKTMMNTAVREQMNAFLNAKVEERLEDRQVYNVKLLSYTMQQREDGRFALLMNFTVENHDVTLFRYQMLDKFNSMVAQPIKEYLGHNGFDVEEADNAQILDLMRENYLPVYYKEDEKDPTRHNIYFNRR